MQKTAGTGIPEPPDGEKLKERPGNMPTRYGSEAKLRHLQIVSIPPSYHHTKMSLEKEQTDTWRTYYQGINRLPEASRLNKVLSKDPGARLEVTSLPEGGYTASDGETLQHMLSVHFPGSDTATPNPQFSRGRQARIS
ncbi:hypothetical protein JTB14_037874 [Gonioctena quinquepunctata]|nr:hypothetical protein JTB14_037874 [Gonioctena quinquepunctata]